MRDLSSRFNNTTAGRISILIVLLAGCAVLTGCPQPIKTLVPEGGEQWQQGSTYTIQWEPSDNGKSKVELWLSRAGQWVGPITKDAPNTGSFDWTVPMNVAADVSYRIFARGVGDETFSAPSGLPFEIVAPPVPAIYTPEVSHDFGTATSEWSFDVWNGGGLNSVLNFEVAADQSWIVCTPKAGSSTGPEDRVSVKVTIDRTMLHKGGNAGVITLTGSNVTQRAINITASMAVPVITLSAGASYDYGRTGTQWSFEVWNEGDPGTVLSFQAAGDKPWIMVSPENGQSSGVGDKKTLTVTINRNLLTSGQNSGVLTVSGGEGVTPRTVSLIVSSPTASIGCSAPPSYDFGRLESNWTFDVWNEGDTGTKLKFNISGNKPWITVSPMTSESDNPDERVPIAVTIDRGALATTSDSGVITIDAGSAIPQRQINLSVGTLESAVGVSATTYDFGTASTQWSFQVWNTGNPGTELQFAATPDKEWVTCTPASGVSTGWEDKKTVNVVALRSKLAAGRNTANIIVTSPGRPPQTIAVSATTPLPAIAISCGNVYDFGYATTEFDFELWNSGDTNTALDFNISSDRAWISCTPTVGTSDGVDDKQTVTVSIDRAMLSDGSSSGTITITGGDVITPRTITLLASTPRPAIGLSATMYDFQLSETATTWSFQLWNSGNPGSTLSFTVAADKNWITCDPLSGTSTGSTDRKTVNITINRSLLALGSNSGVIQISSPGISPANVVVYASALRPAIYVSSPRHDFQVSESLWSFDVWNSGDEGSTLDFSVAQDQPWIECSPSQGSSTGPVNRRTIDVAIDRDLLVPGITNVGSIQVSARNLAPTTITITAMTPMPVLSVSDYMYDFEMFATTWDFDVWNSGDAGSTLSFTVATDRNWLSATPTISTSTGSGDRKAITVTVNRTLLTSGRNTGVISISSPGRSPVNITVSATKPAPVIACSASNHDFGTSENQWTFDVWNSDTNGSSLSVQVADDQEWMNATPITVTSSGPADRKEVTVTLDRAELPAGSTGGTISLSGPGLSTWNIHVSAAKSKSVWVNSASKAETPDGASIASAYPTISEGVKGAAAQAVSEVWVVGGEYMETATLHDTIAVYGGFAGTEADRDDRDWVANPCVVDAANEGPCVAAASGATLDGFTLQNGAALADSVLVAPGDSGVTVENCVFAASGDVWSVKANN